MTFAKIETHEPDGILKLAPPFWGKPRIASWLIAHLAEVQALEDAIWSFIDGIDVDTAERFALEGLAKIVGEPTRPADDEELRMRIKARILVNRSDGTPAALAALIAALSDVTGTGTYEVHVLEFAEETRVLHYTNPPYDTDVAAEMLDAAADAGNQTAWLTGCGTGAVMWPDYNDASPDSTYRFGVGLWPDFHGARS